MKALSEYAANYQNLNIERSESGVLEVRFHTDGGVLKWGEAAEQVWQAFSDIGEDPDNRLIVLTGTGDVFCTDFVIDTSEDGNPVGWTKVLGNARRFIDNLIDLPVPVIGAVNGPVHVHPELFALSDVVIAADHATFRDFHLGSLDTPGGIVPGDGGHFIWPLVLGANRGRYFLLTGQELSAEQGLNYGLVNEVLPIAQVLPRARLIAEQLAANQTTLTLRYTRKIGRAHV